MMTTRRRQGYGSVSTAACSAYPWLCSAKRSTKGKAHSRGGTSSAPAASTKLSGSATKATWGGQLPDVGDAVQMASGQAWWRTVVRKCAEVGHLLTDERDDLKRAADMQLLLQPPMDPNSRKIKLGEQKEGRDGRMWEVTELRENLFEEKEDEGGLEEGAGEEEADKKEVAKSLAAVREWRLLEVQPAAAAAQPAPAAAGRSNPKRGGGAEAEMEVEVGGGGGRCGRGVCSRRRLQVEEGRQSEASEQLSQGRR